MKRICIIGNSHLASLKKGWNDIYQEKRSINKLTFFGVSGGLLKSGVFKIKEGYLYTDSIEINHSFQLTSGGKDSVFLEDYDYFVLYGLSINFINLVMLYTPFRAEKHSRQISRAIYISNECFDYAAERMFNKMPGKEIFDLLKSHTRKPIFIATSPYPSKIICERKRNWTEILKYEDYVSLKNQYELVVKRTFFNATKIIFPPKEVLDFPITTICSYTDESPTLNLNHKYKDAYHMNSDYGIIILKKIFRAINQFQN